MEHLDTLSRADLIRLILELQRQIGDLRKQKEELQRKDKRSGAPFSKGEREEESEAAGTQARARRVLAPPETVRRRQ